MIIPVRKPKPAKSALLSMLSETKNQTGVTFKNSTATSLQHLDRVPFFILENYLIIR